MAKGDVLNFRVPHDLKLALKRAASRDDRSMSMMAVRILREWLTQQGRLAELHARPRGMRGPGRPRR